MLPQKKCEVKGKIDFAKISRENPIEEIALRFFAISARRVGAQRFLERCPLCGDSSHKKFKHFAINPKTASRGRCFRCGFAGDAIDLIAQARNIDKREAAEAIGGIEAPILPWPKKQSATKEMPKTSGKAREIWDAARILSTEEAMALLEKRGFPESMQECASDWLIANARVNAYRGREWLVLAGQAEPFGVLRVALDNPSEKRDLGRKIALSLAAPNSKRCIIVESLWNALAIYSAGISAVAVQSCTAPQLPKILEKSHTQNKIEVALWLDKDAEAKQEELCTKFGLRGLFFEETAPKNNYDVNDLLRDTGEEFRAEIEKMWRERRATSKREILPEGTSELFDAYPLRDFLAASGISICPTCEGEIQLDASGYRSFCKCGTLDVLDWQASVENVSRVEAAKTLLAHREAKEREQAALLESLELQNAEEPCNLSLAEEIEVAANDKTIFFCETPTGAGKTRAALEAAISLALQGERVVFVAPDNAAMQDALGRFLAICETRGIDPPTFARLCESTLDKFGPHDTHGIVFTNQSYLGTKPHSASGFVQFARCKADAHVIIDEAHLLERVICVDIPLYNRYEQSKTQDGAWRLAQKCPANVGRANCETCKIAQCEAQERHDWQPLRRIQSCDFAKYTGYRPLVEWLADAHEIETYTPAWHTVSIRPIESTSKIPRDIEQDSTLHTRPEILEFLRPYLRNTRLVAETPCLGHGEESTPVLPESLDYSIPGQVRVGGEDVSARLHYPAYSCTSSLCADSAFPLANLMNRSKIKYSAGDITLESTFAPAKSVALLSATLPPWLATLAKDVANESGVDIRDAHKRCNPWSFNVSCLRTPKSITRSALAGAMELAGDMGTKSLSACRSKASAREFFYEFRNRLKANVALYEDGDFTRAQALRGQGEWQGILTYALSAFCKGFDFGEAHLVTIDCSCLIPARSLREIAPGLTAEKKLALAGTSLRANLRQIVGRLLRSEIPFKEGETQADGKQIVVVLHNVPEKLSDFATVDNTLCHALNYHDCDNERSWLSIIESQHVESALESIRRALSGEEPQNWRAIDAKKISEKAKRDMSRSQRALVAGEKKDKSRLIDLLPKIVALSRSGAKWNEVSRSLNIARLSAKDRATAKREFFAANQ